MSKVFFREIDASHVTGCFHKFHKESSKLRYPSKPKKSRIRNLLTSPLRLFDKQNTIFREIDVGHMTDCRRGFSKQEFSNLAIVSRLQFSARENRWG